MILVTAATGDVGRQVVSQLHERRPAVRAIARDPHADAFPDGVELTVADLSEPDTLEPHLDQVDAVFRLWPFTSTEAGGTQRCEEVGFSEHARQPFSSRVAEAQAPDEDLARELLGGEAADAGAGTGDQDVDIWSSFWMRSRGACRAGAPLTRRRRWRRGPVRSPTGRGPPGSGHLRDVLGGAPALHRVQRRDVVDQLLGLALEEQRRRGRAGRDGVDGDVPSTQLDQRQGLDGALRSGVGAIGRRLEPGDRGRVVDDRSALADLCRAAS